MFLVAWGRVVRTHGIFVSGWTQINNLMAEVEVMTIPSAVGLLITVDMSRGGVNRNRWMRMEEEKDNNAAAMGYITLQLLEIKRML